MSTEKADFLKEFEGIKAAYNIAMLEIKKLKEDKKPPRTEEEMTVLKQKCLRLIENVFEKPMTLPDNFDDIREQWSAVCVMVQHLAEIKSNLSAANQAIADKPNKFLKGTLCTALAVMVGGTAFGYLAPEVSYCVASRVGSAALRLGQFLAPHITTHGSALLQKALGNNSSNTQNNNNNNNNLASIVTLAAGALSSVSAFQSQQPTLEKSAEANKSKVGMHFQNKEKSSIKIKKEQKKP